MAGGYEKGFTIEYVHKDKRKLSCSDCYFYDRSDKSCGKSSRYLPVDGYDSWKYCDYFEIDTESSYKDEKTAQYNNWIRRKNKKEDTTRQEKKSTITEGKKEVNVNVDEEILINKHLSPVQMTSTYKNSLKPKTKLGFMEDGKNYLTYSEINNLKLVICNDIYDVPKPRKGRFIPVKVDKKKKEKILQVFVADGKVFYCKDKYPETFLQAVVSIFPNKE